MKLRQKEKQKAKTKYKEIERKRDRERGRGVGTGREIADSDARRCLTSFTFFTNFVFYFCTLPINPIFITLVQIGFLLQPKKYAVPQKLDSSVVSQGNTPKYSCAEVREVGLGSKDP